MAYSKLEAQPPLREEALATDELGEGLYAGEAAIKLDSGHLVAISIDQRRMESGEGAAFHGSARWIDGKGQSRVDAHGQHVEANFSHNASIAEIERFGLAAIQKEIALVLLGEEPTQVEVAVDKAAPAHIAPPEGAILSPDAASAPLLGWSDDIRLNGSIRRAIKSATEIEAEADISAILNL